MARYWAVAALRLSECDYAPLNYRNYAREVQTYLNEVAKAAREHNVAVDLTSARKAAVNWEQASGAAIDTAEKATRTGDRPRVEQIHKALLRVERALLDPVGLQGRPWFKHLIYAPRPTYKALVLPGLSEAVEAGDGVRATAEAERLTRALNRATAAIRSLP